MKFDPATSLRIVNNQRLMRATHRGEYRDLGGALAILSEAPLPEWNCLEAFTTDDRRVEGLLDVGFALLRAFDQPPAARTTPLDRPADVEARLRQRRLVPAGRFTSMVFRGDAGGIRTNRDVGVRIATPDDASAYATVEAQVTAPKARWGKGFLLGAALANVLELDRTFYMAYRGDEPAGIALVVREGDVAGVYSVATLKSHRGNGVASTLVAQAIADAEREGARLICLECETDAEPMRLFTSLGFAFAHEASLWVGDLV
jgi:ribosomal-protein-alanine N-acetyltransferase